MKLDLDHSKGEKASSAIKEIESVSVLSGFTGSSLSRYGLTGSGLSGSNSSINGSSTSGDEVSILKRQKHELELKLKEEVRTYHSKLT